MVDYILKAVEYIWKIIPRLIRPISVEVQSLYCQLIGSDPYESVTVATAWLKRYRAELLFLNRMNTVVFIKDVSLAIGNEKTYKPFEEVTEIRLEPHQARKISLVFPVPDEDKPVEAGSYELRVMPTSGRRSSVRGHFPIGDD